jgi:hypothetical protein
MLRVRPLRLLSRSACSVLQKRSAYAGKPPPEQKAQRLPNSYLSGGSLALGFIALGYWFMNQRLKQSFWVSTPAIVDSCSQVHDDVNIVSYSFKIGNETFDGRQRTKKLFDIGKPITIYVDPKNPMHKNVINREPLSDVAAGLVILTMGLYSLKKTFR